VVVEFYYLFILFILQESIGESDLLIETLIKKFSLCWTSFYIYFYYYLDMYELKFIWTLFKI